jgi:hypothetical protein
MDPGSTRLPCGKGRHDVRTWIVLVLVLVLALARCGRCTLTPPQPGINWHPPGNPAVVRQFRQEEQP